MTGPGSANDAAPGDAPAARAAPTSTGAPAPGSDRPPLDAERLAGLVFELASQLHAERLHRLALEHALGRAGLLGPAALAEAATDAALGERGRREVEASVARLLRVITENADPRTPLRDHDGGS